MDTILPTFCQPIRTEPHEPVPPWTTNPPRLVLTSANATQTNRAGRTRMSGTRL